MAKELKNKPDRKNLTFEQAEGVEPLPSQLKPKEVSQELRARLWNVFLQSLQVHIIRRNPVFDEPDEVIGPWSWILYKKHVERDHKMADEYDANPDSQITSLKKTFTNGDYVQLFGLIEWILREGGAPGLAQGVEQALEAGHAAYSLVDGDTIVPKGSEAEQEAIAQAFADVSAAEFGGAREHLRNAATELTGGNYADSIRESVHAVESVARILEGGANTLGPALNKLEKNIKLHGALRAGFENLYGFTSDAKGIRHSLLDEPVAAVDEADALYMLGSCAAFVSYLINKARQAGLIKKKK